MDIFVSGSNCFVNMAKSSNMLILAGATAQGKAAPVEGRRRRVDRFAAAGGVSVRADVPRHVHGSVALSGNI